MTLRDDQVFGNRAGRLRMRRVGKLSSYAVADYLRRNGATLVEGERLDDVGHIVPRAELPRLQLFCAGLTTSVEVEALRRAGEAVDLLYSMAFPTIAEAPRRAMIERRLEDAREAGDD